MMKEKRSYKKSKLMPVTFRRMAKIVKSQSRFLFKKFGEEKAYKANYGKGITNYEIYTKVYGEGDLISEIRFTGGYERIIHHFNEA
tara:strand:+ start:151 stop:408 length:258 start_codon:yes stop_codon:yes gene_type:complete